MNQTAEAPAAPPSSQNHQPRSHHMPFGAEIVSPGAVRFRLWAPAASSVNLEIVGLQPALQLWPQGDGWYQITTPLAQPGSRYQFILPDGMRIPDPASRFQPEDAHGPSEVIDPAAYAWTDTAWAGRSWSEAVIYEIHIGTFTPAGTFLAAIEKLQHLADLGVTAIQIMPIADFPGDRNWGYDGVLPYAPESSYGRPEDLKALVEAAHALGLMVFLDVVYNHFGPDGNYLAVYAPQIFTDRHRTPWGDAVNYDGKDSWPVRQFAIHCAMYWLEEYHFDGLRLDAVHQIKDDGPEHLLDEIARRIRAKDWGRPIHLILENESNEAFRLIRNDRDEPTEFTAQWNDDIHHVLHTAATGENHSYYRDFAGKPEMLARALAQGFAFQGQMMESLGRERGMSSTELPPSAFVAFIQNHDQIGNRAFGDRISTLASSETVHAIAAAYLLLPQIPMLFMGEEWGTRQPFPFFCDFPGELGDQVRNGRRDEFADLPEFQDPEKRKQIPDPGADSTFQAGKLQWEELSQPEHSDWLDWYKRVLQVRREKIVPLVFQIGGFAGRYRVHGPGAVTVYWQVSPEAHLVLDTNLSAQGLDNPLDTESEIVWQQGPLQDNRLGPWSLRWSLKAGAMPDIPA